MASMAHLKVHHKAKNFLFAYSKYAGLWVDGNEYKYVIASIVVNLVDAIGKTIYFIYRFHSGLFLSHYYLEILRNVISKGIFIAHWLKLYRKPRQFSQLAKFIEQRGTSRIIHLCFFGGILLFLFRIIAIIGFDHYARDFSDLISTITFLYFNFNEFMIVMQYSILLNLINNGVKAINKNARHSVFQFDLFDGLVGLCRTVDWLYGLQVFLVLSQVFVFLVNYSYTQLGAVSCVLYSCSFSIYPTLQFYISWNISGLGYAMFVLLILVSHCENTSDMVDNFTDTLFKVAGKSPFLMKNKRLKLYLLMKPSVKLTAFSFFRVRYSLVISILAAVATYLVMISQFNEFSKLLDYARYKKD